MADEKKNMKCPSDLLTETVVQRVILTDLGSEVKLKSWSIKNFTNKGDNYASFVTSIEAEIEDSNSDTKSIISYIAKLNPCRVSDAWNSVTNKIFVHEGDFFVQVAPQLNKILQSLSFKSLNIPNCYFTSYEEGKEMIVNNDLRRNEFKMAVKSNGLDFEHVSLVIKEIARLHASSYVLKKQSTQCLDDMFPILKHRFYQDSESPITIMFNAFITARFETFIRILEDLEEYKYAIEVIKKYKEDGIVDLLGQLTAGDPNSVFETICHGDLWINNILFK